MFESRTYDDIEYRVWTSLPLQASKYPTLGHRELKITPANLMKITPRADELFEQIKFDAIRFYCPAGQNYDHTIEVESLAPYVQCLIFEESCRRIDFSKFTCMTEVLEFRTMIPKPKKLLLRNFPKIWRAALGQIDDSNVLINVPSLGNLDLYRKLHIAKTGWKWLGTLPNLRKFSMIQFEMSSLLGIEPNLSIDTLVIAYPRTFISFDGIQAFSNLQRLEVEGAKQITDLSPIADLKKLRQLSIIGCPKPKSWEFLKKLPDLEWAGFDGDYVWENGSFTKKALTLVSS
jgi:hypothetical protein